MSNKLNHTRFKDLPWYGEPLEIILGGVGGIGSWVAMYLGRIGHKLYIYDDDTLEESNMGGQLYQFNQIGQQKSYATINNMLYFSKNYGSEGLGRYEVDSMAAPIMISAFDNIEARKNMFNNWLAQEDKEIFIDPRMQSEYGEIFTITKDTLDRVELYQKYLFDDSEVEDLPCTAKATSHCGAILGGFVTSILNNYIANQKMENDFRDIPFKLSYDLVWFDFKLENQ